MVNMSVPRLSFDQVIDGLISSKQSHFSSYLAMYSSWYQGIVIDPALMLVPVDDHLVHRGDGIFEAFKCTNWNIYALDRHLERMKHSLATSGLECPVDRSHLIEIIRETVRAGNAPDCIIRVFISRGPGSFTASPYDTVGSQLYVVVTEYIPTPKERYEKGVTLVTVGVPVKSDYFATVKNCNYLPNVLMKKAATDTGADYPISLDERGFLAEGATENIGIVTGKGELLIPRFLRTLRGITVTRTLELARQMLGKELTVVAEADITRELAYAASEMLVFGTSFNILPVVEYDGRMIGNGKPGPIFGKLLEMIADDVANNPEMLTPVAG